MEEFLFRFKINAFNPTLKSISFSVIEKICNNATLSKFEVKQ